MHWRRNVIGLVCLLFAASAAAETKVGFRQLTIVEPVAVQRGAELDVTLRSNYTLDGTHSVFFDRPGIEMTFAETEAKAATRRGRGSDGTPFQFHVKVPQDQPVGPYELRVATEQAVSSVSHLFVTDYSVVREDEKQSNNSADTAVPFELPAALVGRVERNEDVDFYEFDGTAGQKVTFELFAQRVTQGIHGMVVRGPLIYLMDGLLTLYGPNGQVIAQNDNFYGGDAFIAATLPEAGKYRLEVRDARYAGSGRYVYVIQAAAGPYAYATLPLAVQSGQSAKTEVVGFNVADDRQAELQAAGEPGWHARPLELPEGTTNPISIGTSLHPQIVASGANLSQEKALPLQIPVGVSARIVKPNSAHYYRVAVKKGAHYLIELTSHQLGLPFDGVIAIYDSAGKLITEADDGLQTKDPKLHWTSTVDGDVVIEVLDLHGRGGERFMYHLAVEPSGPDFELHGEYYYAQVAPGTNMVWFARINRLNGFDGAVEIRVEGLPEGVKQVPVTIPAGMTHCAVILQGDDNAPINGSLVQVVGEAKVTGADGEVRRLVRRGRVTCEQQGSGGGQARFPIQTQIVGVTKPLDLLSVKASPDRIDLKPGESATIDVEIVRNAEFKDPVTLAMSFDYFTTKFGEQLPPGVTVGKASQLRLSGQTLKGKVVLEASDKALAVEALPLSVLARVSITFSITTNYGSNPIWLTVSGEPAAEK